MKLLTNFRSIGMICLFILNGYYQILPAQAFQIDESLSMKAFEQTVLKPKDEVWVVDFWASWCRPCIESIPELKAEYQKLQSEKVRFISISWDSDSKAWKGMVIRMQLPWGQIFLPDIRNAPFIDKNFPHKSIPALFLVTREGKVKKVTEITRLGKMIEKELAD